MKDVLPRIENISDYYGKSLFHCSYCDGWELRDKPLVIILGEQVQGFHFIQTIYNWSKDLIVCTNGEAFQNIAQKELLQKKGIKIMESKIKNFVGKKGQMEKVIFEEGKPLAYEVARRRLSLAIRVPFYLTQTSGFHFNNF